MRNNSICSPRFTLFDLAEIKKRVKAELSARGLSSRLDAMVVPEGYVGRDRLVVVVYPLYTNKAISSPCLILDFADVGCLDSAIPTLIDGCLSPESYVSTQPTQEEWEALVRGRPRHGRR